VLLCCAGREKKELQGMEKAIETLHKQRKDYEAKLEKGHEVSAIL
jgi:hypothetical protein